MSYSKIIKQINNLYEDDNLIVVSKPSGLLTIADRHDSTIPNLKDILRKKYDAIYTVHRLDRETSGCIVFAKNEVTHKYLNQLFATQQVHKKYWAFVAGIPALDSGCIDMPILNDMKNSGKMRIDKNGKDAITDFQLLEKYGNIALIEFEPITGRTHQIRVHSHFLGCPLLVDNLYHKEAFYLSSIKRKYKQGRFEEERPLVNRLTLHAKSLSFPLQNNELISIESELPKELNALQNQLRKI